MFKRCLVLKKHDTERLFGEIYEDMRFADGHWILTSEVVTHNNSIYVTKSGTRYDVEKRITLEEFCEILIKELLPTTNVHRCLFIARTIQTHHDCDKWFNQFVDNLAKRANCP